MKTINRNIELPVDRLYPHPDNPRKDVGDVSELAESIKTNGIFQNLTVVPGGKGAPSDADYTVIIGHRRLAAAKQAGLKTVPCMVAEMDEREQAATMLLENMQRTDLTVFEQAQGFQMMLNLGETQDGIARKTGFSKTTIRHRLKLLELDPEELRKAQERQATFADYIEIEKLSDPNNKNEALKAIGTANFKWKVQQLVGKENAVAFMREWCAFLDENLEKIAYDKRLDYLHLNSFCITSIPLSDEKKRQFADYVDCGAKYYTTSGDGTHYVWAYIYKDKKEKTEEEKAAQLEREKSETERRERTNRLQTLEEQARELRRAFVKNFAGKEYTPYLLEKLLSETNLDLVDYEETARFLSLEVNEDDCADFLASEEYKAKIKIHPESVMLAMLASIYEYELRLSLHDYFGRYTRNEQLERWYEILSKLGYSISDEEQKLLSGTHEEYQHV